MRIETIFKSSYTFLCKLKNWYLFYLFLFLFLFWIRSGSIKHISACDEQIIGVLRVVIRTLKSSLKLILFEINVILTGTAFHFSVFIIMFRLQNFQRELDFIFDQLCFVYRQTQFSFANREFSRSRIWHLFKRQDTSPKN